jgi:hypothetical protein
MRGILFILLLIVVILFAILLQTPQVVAHLGAGEMPSYEQEIPVINLGAEKNVYSQDMLSALYRTIDNRTFENPFGPATPAEEKALQHLAVNLNKKYSTKLDLDAILALRHDRIAQRTITSHRKATQAGKTTLEEIRKGRTITELSKRHGCSPIALMRQMFLAAGWSKTEVKRWMQGRPAPSSSSIDAKTIAMLRDELDSLEDTDFTSRKFMDAQLADSGTYEKTIGCLLSRKSVKFQTEEQQKERAVEEGIILGSTPDFLLDEPVALLVPDAEEPVVVHWLDAKNSANVGSLVTAEGLKKQAEKYNRKFGHGAFVFRHGIMEGADMPASMVSVSS